MSLVLKLLLLSLLTFPAFAGNAVLLTSLELNKLNKLYLESKFKQAFVGRPQKLIIHHQTTPALLQKILQDEETELLMWVSHAGEVQAQKNGLASKGAIVDIYGNDVKKFFSKPSKKMKFLGLIGCSAKTIIDGFKERGSYRHHANLEIMSYERPVRLYTAFEETLLASLSHLDRELRTDGEEGENVEIEVEASGDLSHAWLELGDEILAVITPESPRVFTMKISSQQWHTMRSKNINFVRSQDKRSEGLLPRLRLTSPEGYWEVFETKNGVAIGGNRSNLYIFKSY